MPSHFTPTSAWEVGMILTPFLPTRKMRHREFKGFGQFLWQVGRIWSLGPWSLTPGLELLVIAPQERIHFLKNSVCRKEGGLYVHVLMTPLQVIKVLLFWELRSSAEGRKKREKGNACRCRVHLDAREGSHPCIDPLGSWHKGQPRTQHRCTGSLSSGHLCWLDRVLYKVLS